MDALLTDRSVSCLWMLQSLLSKYWYCDETLRFIQELRKHVHFSPRIFVPLNPY